MIRCSRPCELPLGGLFDALYLDDLCEKTHRGLAGQIKRGFCAGGRSFGYRTVDATAGGKRLVIDETEASGAALHGVPSAQAELQADVRALLAEQPRHSDRRVYRNGCGGVQFLP